METTTNPRNSIPILAIVTSKYLALGVRMLALPVDIAALILTIIISHHSKQISFTLLITVVLSTACNALDAIALILDILKPLPYPLPTNIGSTHRYHRKTSYRAFPRWRGLIDIAILTTLMIGVFGMNDCTNANLKPYHVVDPVDAKWAWCRANGKRRAATVDLGVVIACAHFWMCAMAILECMWEHRNKELVARGRSVS